MNDPQIGWSLMLTKPNFQQPEHDELGSKAVSSFPPVSKVTCSISGVPVLHTFPGKGMEQKVHLNTHTVPAGLHQVRP